jgi:hypothetical protein
LAGWKRIAMCATAATAALSCSCAVPYLACVETLARLKRGLKGTYVSVEPFHLFRYLDEQVFRFNNRKMNDGDRFNMVVREIVGKRLTWNQLTGKEGETAEVA